jgi:hypothetical protein
MPGRREIEELVEQEDRSIDKPRKRSGGAGRERHTPTSHPEQHEEFAGTEGGEPAEEESGRPGQSAGRVHPGGASGHSASGLAGGG